jgi:hypothetical protein
LPIFGALCFFRSAVYESEDAVRTWPGSRRAGTPISRKRSRRGWRCAHQNRKS